MLCRVIRTTQTAPGMSRPRVLGDPVPHRIPAAPDVHRSSTGIARRARIETTVADSRRRDEELCDRDS